MSLKPVQIPNGSLTLEGVLFSPDDTAVDSVVVVCHPHPQHGGDMHNNVVMVLVQALYERGIAALAFNFRGVGSSQGDYDDGNGEQDDVRAALAFASAIESVRQVGLAGYSFGAGMAASTVDGSVAALAVVSVPAARLDAPALKRYAGPVLLAAGDRDHVSSVDALSNAAGSLLNAEAVTVPGVDHFWWGHEAQLRDIVGSFFDRALKTLPAK